MATQEQWTRLGLVLEAFAAALPADSGLRIVEDIRAVLADSEQVNMLEAMAEVYGTAYLKVSHNSGRYTYDCLNPGEVIERTSGDPVPPPS